ncbi:MAG: Extracellular solute-binding protein family 5 [Candidatus Uhrbacteria bacterium GW2011_GWD2_52_7]|uniref:Extracellular solute-binding protein family 5 n=1 Tax=Candidatus Uhrbacteria bacterium GW2011_GWD2_52_7 TaxID=1618989 RepID=A0A0G1XI32_9BACT|nr:MAG: Extracellular solute-binding protein family 5 [Candidatus Uhrbacteria bacterium GW2011_GWD2_52_7]
MRSKGGVPTLAQWRQLPRFLSTRERKFASFALGAFVIAVAGLGFQWLNKNQTTIPAVGGEYTEGVVGTPQFINPLYATASDVDADLSRLVYSGLMRFDPQDGIVPDLASNYTVSEDEKEYVFTLRSDAKWHDSNDVVTASDVAFTISAIQNPEYHSPLAVSFAGIAVEAVDTSTVKFTLDEPFSPFLAALTVGILPAFEWQDIAPSSAQLAIQNIKPVGSGPYQFAKLVKDNRGSIRSMTLERNPDFYRGAPYIKKLSFKFYSSVTELTDALRNKNVEGASVISSADASAFSDERGLSLQNPSLPQFTAAFFNAKHSSVLADDEVRKALSLAVDRTAIVQITGSVASAINSPILSGMPGYDASATVPVADSTTAASTLDAAGWTFTEGATVRSKSDKSLSFTITTLDSPELTAAAQELERQWEAIGASVDVAVVDIATLQSDVLKNRSYDILVAGERYGTFADPYPFWHSSQTSYPGLNLGSFSDRKADEAIETARETTDQTKRAEAFASLSGLIAEDMPAIMLYQPKYTFALASKIRGVDVPSVTVPSDRFADVETWYIKAKHEFFR